MLINKYEREFEDLGWKLNDFATMNDYYVFERQQEKLCIDMDKMKIEHYMFDIDSLPELSYETLELVMEVFEERR